MEQFLTRMFRKKNVNESKFDESYFTDCDQTRKVIRFKLSALLPYRRGRGSRTTVCFSIFTLLMQTSFVLLVMIMSFHIFF